MKDVIDLGIDLLAEYDDARSVGLEEARRLMRGRSGPVALEVARRWAGRGCRPAGPEGPVLFLPAVKISHEWRTLPEWVRAFERKRLELETCGVAPPPTARPERSRAAGHRHAERRLDALGCGKAG